MKWSYHRVPNYDGPDPIGKQLIRWVNWTGFIIAIVISIAFVQFKWDRWNRPRIKTVSAEIYADENALSTVGSWSPDGRSVLFFRRGAAMDGSMELGTINVATGEVAYANLPGYRSYGTNQKLVQWQGTSTVLFGKTRYRGASTRHSVQYVQYDWQTQQTKILYQFLPPSTLGCIDRANRDILLHDDSTYDGQLLSVSETTRDAVVLKYADDESDQLRTMFVACHPKGHQIFILNVQSFEESQGVWRLIRWDRRSGQIDVIFESEDRQIHHFDVSPDGKWLAAREGRWLEPKQLVLISVESGHVYVIPGTPKFRSVAWSPDGESLLVVEERSRIDDAAFHIVDLSDWECLKSLCAED